MVLCIPGRPPPPRSECMFNSFSPLPTPSQLGEGSAMLWPNSSIIAKVAPLSWRTQWFRPVPSTFSLESSLLSRQGRFTCHTGFACYLHAPHCCSHLAPWPLKPRPLVPGPTNHGRPQRRGDWIKPYDLNRPCPVPVGVASLAGLFLPVTFTLHIATAILLPGLSSPAPLCHGRPMTGGH